MEYIEKSIDVSADIFNRLNLKTLHQFEGISSGVERSTKMLLMSGCADVQYQWLLQPVHN